MKPIRIEFVPQRRWLVYWSGLCIVLVVTSGMFYTRQRAVDVARESLEAQSGKANVQIVAIRPSSQHSSDANKAAADLSLSRAAQGHLQQDWNPAFATIENVMEPGARLLQVSMDSASGNIRLEYEVESLAEATTLTSSMNSGIVAAPWNLESVTASSVTGGSQRMHATWSAKLKDLR
jgi:hypothetical protein